MFLFDAIKKQLDFLQLKVYDGDATEAAGPPYVIIDYALATRSDEEPVEGAPTRADVTVRAVGVNAQQARTLLEACRRLLRGHTVEGEYARYSFQLDGCPRGVVVDRTVRNRATDTNLVFVDDEYSVFIEGK
ncbi:hypothetical protein ACX3T3_05510 [Actinotignum schaalii]|uniref:hypothetical protein n=1 Tax=Actinotignum TaxID=1653174 RepID=UPI00237D5C34|nr:hypothetical protein [Actinotignum sanguinis]MDE1552221.1 hypothetical protein [Actinotignum sanguinis]